MDFSVCSSRSRQCRLVLACMMLGFAGFLLVGGRLSDRVGGTVVTFATVRATAPIVILTNLSPGAGSASSYSGSYGAKVTTAGFTVEALAAVTLSSTVVLGYLVIDVE